MSQAPGGRRMFFALWPHPQWVKALQATLAEVRLEGRLTHEQKWHITLLFLGQIVEDQISCVRTAASSIRADGFNLQMTQFSFKKRPGMLWITPANTPPAAREMEQQLRQSLNACELKLENRPFTPHLTLARRMKKRPALPEPVLPVWPVDRFSLVESVAENGGVRYETIQTWLLNTQ